MNSWLLIALIVFGILYISDHLNRINKRLKWTEDKLDQITKQIEIPEHTINDELRQLVTDGEKIKAIKKAREVLGLSLLEAKNYVDSL
ncbi:ribosomal protein L7/L12 [Bacillus cytotoxicus]|uniref:Ribosomal protein L7/L12 n=1 Tax=Bacillus cytotoxicus TaxID=580165 RepID=A0ACC6A1B8_9BACI|nr:ribosomal protein L7/L12 [Bacillus cytotoxicus]